MKLEEETARSNTHFFINEKDTIYKEKYVIVEKQLAFEAPRTGLSTVGASYLQIKKIILNDGMYLSMSKTLFNKTDHNGTVCVFGNSQAKSHLDGQRRCPGPGQRRQP